MRYLNVLIVLAIALIVLSILLGDNALDRQIKEALHAPPPAGLRHFNAHNYAQATRTGEKISEGDIQDHLRNSPDGDADHFLKWSSRKRNLVTFSAMGTDRQHHIIHGYLEGYAPFPAKEPWQPLYVLASRLHYQYDHEQFAGLREVWQTSRQAFFNTRGDCEDHALLLADWLIGSGYDARVVLGDVKGEGHAWVVVYDDGKTYVLEATDKRRRKSWQHLPLAQFASRYSPHYMFNRDTLWQSTSHNGYALAAWDRVSSYHLGN